MDQNYEILLTEKNELERALATVQDILYKTTTEKEQIHKVLQDFKSHFEIIKSECSQQQKRLVEEITKRKEVEQQCEMRLNDMRRAIESK